MTAARSSARPVGFAPPPENARRYAALIPGATGHDAGAARACETATVDGPRRAVPSRVAQGRDHALERHVPRQAVEEQARERVDVGPGVDILARSHDGRIVARK